MKNLKTGGIIAMSFIVLCSTTLSASAQSVWSPMNSTPPTTIAPNPPIFEATNFFPGNLDQYYEFDLSVKNPFDGLIKNLTQAVPTSETGTEGNLMAILLRSAHGKISYGMKINFDRPVTQGGSPNIDHFLAVHTTPLGLNQLLQNFENPKAEVKSEIYESTKIYNPDPEAYFMVFNDLIIVTSSREGAMSVADNFIKKSTDTIANNTGFQYVKKQALPQGFLIVYLNPSTILKQNDVMASLDNSPLKGLFALGKSVISALTAEGFSIAQTDKGFQLNFMMTGDKAKLTQLNLNFDKYNFVPELYKYLSAKDLMMYSEEFNFQEKIKNLLTIFGTNETAKDWSAWKMKFKTETQIDFDNELLPLLKGKYAFAIHKTNQVIPGMTLMFDVRSDVQKTNDLLTKFINYTQKNIAKTANKDAVKLETTSINGTPSYVMTFNTKNPFDNENLKITLNMAVTNNGLLVISTHPQLGNILLKDFSGNITDNADFNANFTNRDEMISGLSYINVDTIHAYVKSIMTSMKAPSESQMIANLLLNSWHSVFSKSYGEADAVVAKMNINVDTNSLISDYQKLLETGFSSTTRSTPLEGFITKESGFCDVHKEDWFYDYVNELTNLTISDSEDGEPGSPLLKGYSDGCFRPNQPITRAEFLSLMMKINHLSDNTPTPYQYDKSKQYFKDVPKGEGAWYSKFVNQRAETFIQEGLGTLGFPDGNFRPNQPINRAEAVQMLFGYYDFPINGNEKLNFKDVRMNDWFYNALTNAVSAKMIDNMPNSNFRPNDKLNRAEAAKLFQMYFNYENQNNSPALSN